jgi:protoporphyrinogen oxidase
MKSVGIIGAGISGLSIAQCLNKEYEVKVFEKDSKAGGLIKCERIEGSLYHVVGGHVFNSKRQDVLDWFWKFFDKDVEFITAPRNAVICMPDGKFVGYPIENHIYQLEEGVIKNVIGDFKCMIKSSNQEVLNFEDFLLSRFGETLYSIYFEPYNKKIWKKDLKNISLSWLEGKLPMPLIEEIIFNNFTHALERQMVHSSFYYAKANGSQFIVDRLSEGIDVSYNTEVSRIKKIGGKWVINECEFDNVIFCGNIKELPNMLEGSIDFGEYSNLIAGLEYHGTTSVLCVVDKNPYSWIYLPSNEYQSHRIICTGNFADSNNIVGLNTATIEFTDYVTKNEIDDTLKKLPLNPQYLSHRYTKYTYPIQTMDTREIVNKVKTISESQGFYLLGRFAEWEYYNMDAAIGAALDLKYNRFLL